MQEPTLLFFRKRPDNLTGNASIASSLQSLESSFFLIALNRFPHALSVCASAIETSLQAADIDAKERDGFQELIRKARRSSSAIEAFSNDSLDQFRELRNRITHRGFSPQDDSDSVSQYLDVGLPFLGICYREFHAFDFMDGLLMEYAEHLNAAQMVLALSRALPDVDKSYCLHGFSHLIRWSFKENFSSAWEIDTLVHYESVGGKFEKTRAERENLEREFGASWSFDCPICHEYEGVVADLDLAALEQKAIKPMCMVCTNCGFVASRSQVFLSQVLLDKQVSASRPEILQDFGIE